MNCLITGVTGQDGSYLAELLLEQGHTVYGVKRRSATNNTTNLAAVLNNPDFHLVEGDVTDCSFITKLITKVNFNEIYHLAAQSFVGASFTIPHYTTTSIYDSTIHILEAIRTYSKETRFYFAGSSEMFGSNYSTTENGIKYQDENTAFCPQSPYSIAKLAGFHLTRLYRECYGLFACSGILFNHESPRRGDQFVTQKVVKYVANLKQHLHSSSLIAPLKLGNLDACRDWGYAPDYVKAMTMILGQDKPRDLVIATGETHSIRELVETAFEYIGMGKYTYNFVAEDPSLKRPAEVNYLCGSPTKAKEILGWEPTLKFKDIIHLMIDHELQIGL
jgi:GDPmannose 4,6-dehydratase